MANCFPYADVHEASVEAVACSMHQYADSTTPPKGLGFTLIKGILVSNSFLGEVERQLVDRLNCFEVHRVTDLFTDSFVRSLTASQLAVLGECVLVLIEMGHVQITLIDKTLAA